MFSFKHPSATELLHDFLWRTTRHLPERGRIGIFNRSYYIESKYMAGAAVVGFLLALLLTGGSLIAAFGVLALVGGIGWVPHRLLR